MRKITFRRRPWQEGKGKLVISIPPALVEEIPRGRLRVTLEEVEEEVREDGE